MADQFEMVRSDPPRALPEAYREITNNIERVKMSASGEWFLIARFESSGRASTRRGTLKRRSEYELFDFYSGKLVPPEPPFTYGLWCKWIGKKKATKVTASVEEDEEPKLHSVKS